MEHLIKDIFETMGGFVKKVTGVEEVKEVRTSESTNTLDGWVHVHKDQNDQEPRAGTDNKLKSRSAISRDNALAAEENFKTVRTLHDPIVPPESYITGREIANFPETSMALFALDETAVNKLLNHLDLPREARIGEDPREGCDFGKRLRILNACCIDFLKVLGQTDDTGDLLERIRAQVPDQRDNMGYVVVEEPMAAQVPDRTEDDEGDLLGCVRAPVAGRTDIKGWIHNDGAV